jgi:Protein of unknown function (DUF1036)
VQLCFQNNYIKRLDVAAAWLNEGMCAGLPRGTVDGWMTGAWWTIKPGDTVATDASTGNRYFYYYAEADDGEFWAGPYKFGVNPGPIEGCGGDLFLGMRQVDAGWWTWSYSTYTVPFL